MSWLDSVIEQMKAKNEKVEQKKVKTASKKMSKEEINQRVKKASKIAIKKSLLKKASVGDKVKYNGFMWEIIDTNFKDADCLRSAIDKCGLSSRRFGDLFNGAFGTTPNKYLILRRIENAKSMLETQGLTVSEVAELCGFSDVYYFSKVFKQVCGVSPSKWK
jgi:AraC-like DNA-binding protein